MKRFFRHTIAFALALLLLFGAFGCCAYAVNGDDDGTPVADETVDDTPVGNDPADEPTDAPSADEPTDADEAPTEATEVSGELDPTEADDAPSPYTEPEYLDDLPAADEGDVVPATAVDVPAAAVSDASLVSGIAMWLCVAVGIAVVVGVLVSKRTRRRGQ